MPTRLKYINPRRGRWIRSVAPALFWAFYVGLPIAFVGACVEIHALRTEKSRTAQLLNSATDELMECLDGAKR